MPGSADTPSNTTQLFELSFTRLLDAPREKLFRCWTEPELLKPWFCPRPWSVSHAEIDARAGGSSYIVMNGPNGEVVPNRGVYLEVRPGERVVFTNAFTAGWAPQPIASPGFMFVGIVEFAEAGAGATNYTARVRHWTAADCEAHRQMGFHEGWGMAADQLAAFVKTI